MRFDLITMGRIGVDLYPEQIGVALADVSTFAQVLGGSPRTSPSRRRGWAPRGGDHQGRRRPVRRLPPRALRGFGVDDRFVGTHPTLRTPVAFCEIHPPDDFPLLFYREPTAPDLTIAVDELDLDAIRAARVFWTTGTGPERRAEPRGDARRAASARARRRSRVHDLDYRPMFWADRGEAGALRAQALRHATVAVGNREEVEVAVGTRDPDAAADELLGLGVELAIVKQGPDGRARAHRAMSGSRSRPCRSRSSTGSAPATRSAARSCHGLLHGLAARARRCGSPTRPARSSPSRLACADAMPDTATSSRTEVAT